MKSMAVYMVTEAPMHPRIPSTNRLAPRLVAILGVALLATILITACEDDDPPGKVTPCTGIDCSGHGECKWDANEVPWCDCDPGYVAYDSFRECTEDATNNVKPIIYLYPEQETRVHLRFADLESMELAFTYPAYPEAGWDVVAQPDGTLTDPETGRRYYALYWEGAIDEPPIPNEGFIVAGEEVADFLEELLPRLGLNWAEADEFIIYWLPVLGANPWNFLTFVTDTWARAVPLSVSPEPTTSIRFGLRWARLEAPPANPPPPQDFTPAERRGFTLVEWGGREIPAPVW